jgi:hypothetical protein
VQTGKNQHALSSLRAGLATLDFSESFIQQLCIDRILHRQYGQSNGRAKMGKEILFIDSDSDARHTFTSILSREGFLVTAVPTTDEGMLLLKDHVSRFSGVIVEFNKDAGQRTAMELAEQYAATLPVAVTSTTIWGDDPPEWNDPYWVSRIEVESTGAVLLIKPFEDEMFQRFLARVENFIVPNAAAPAVPGPAP